MSKKETAQSTAMDFDAMKQSTKEVLDAQPKRTIRIKYNGGIPGAKEQNYEFVCINGHTYQIMKGVDVEVPQTVYEVLVNAGVI